MLMIMLLPMNAMISQLIVTFMEPCTKTHTLLAYIPVLCNILAITSAPVLMGIPCIVFDAMVILFIWIHWDED